MERLGREAKPNKLRSGLEWIGLKRLEWREGRPERQSGKERNGEQRRQFKWIFSGAGD